MSVLKLVCSEVLEAMDGRFDSDSGIDNSDEWNIHLTTTAGAFASEMDCDLQSLESSAGCDGITEMDSSIPLTSDCVVIHTVHPDLCVDCYVVCDPSGEQIRSLCWHVD